MSPTNRFAMIFAAVLGRFRRIRIPVVAIAGVSAALALAACSSSGSKPSAASSTGAASTPATGPTQQPAGSGAAVTATESEFHIGLSSQTLHAGTYTFQVKNSGSITHALTVDGPGVKDKSTGDVAPGSSSTLTVTLKAGSYTVYCPVGNHKMEGMRETVKVT